MSSLRKIAKAKGEEMTKKGKKQKKKQIGKTTKKIKTSQKENKI